MIILHTVCILVTLNKHIRYLSFLPKTSFSMRTTSPAFESLRIESFDNILVSYESSIHSNKLFFRLGIELTPRPTSNRGGDHINHQAVCVSVYVSLRKLP